MRMKKYIIVLFLTSLQSAFSLPWLGIAHYEITKAAGSDYYFYAKNSQIADYEPNMYLGKFDWGVFVFGDIPKGFLWTHATQYCGYIPVNAILFLEGRLPIAPAGYPDDGRYPGPDMLEFIEKKIKNPPEGDEKLICKDAFMGWVAHNAADRVVHYNYFLGYRPDLDGDDVVDGAFIWLDHHKKKEQLSEYMIYFYLYFGGTPTFSSDGKIILVAEYASEHGTPCYSYIGETIAKYTILSQKVYRKNRYGRNKDSSDVVTSIEKIKQLHTEEVSKQAKAINDFTEDDFNKLARKMVEYNQQYDPSHRYYWGGMGSVMERFEAARQNVSEWITYWEAKYPN